MNGKAWPWPLKFAKLRDRNPVKLTIILLPELPPQLGAYAAGYWERYSQEEGVADLIA